MPANSKRFAVSAFALVAALTPAAAQDSGERSVDQYTCKQVMRETGADRDVAIAFLHGYFVAKSGSLKFNVETLKRQSDAFIDRCLDNPNEKALEAMTKAKG